MGKGAKYQFCTLTKKGNELFNKRSTYSKTGKSTRCGELSVGANNPLALKHLIVDDKQSSKAYLKQSSATC